MQQPTSEDVIRGSGLPYVIVRPCGVLTTTDELRGAPLELTTHRGGVECEGDTIAQVECDLRLDPCPLSGCM